MVLIFPYFLIVWRVVVGRYIHTNSQLFIGERRGDSKPKVYEEEDDETDSFSNSLSHWIVAIKIPAEADSLEEPTEENGIAEIYLKRKNYHTLYGKILSNQRHHAYGVTLSYVFRLHYGETLSNHLRHLYGRILSHCVT